MKRRTFVDFIRTEVTQNGNEVKVKMLAKLQHNRLPFDGVYEIYGKRFQNISRGGVFEVTGTAKCSPEDEFDFNRGRFIAETRAQTKAYRIATRVFDHIVDVVSDDLQYIASISLNCEDCANEAEKHIEKLSE